MSDSLPPHGLQHARLPCLSPSPGACSNSSLLSRWCHPTISSSAVPFSSCPQSFPASGSFPMGQLFTSGDQSTGTSASVFLMNNQDWFPLGLTGFDLLTVQGTLQESYPAPQFESIISLALSLLYGPTLWFNCVWLLEKPCVHVCLCVQLCLTLCDPVDCSPLGGSVHGIFQARILEWVAISSSRVSFWLWDGTCISCVSCTGRQILYHCAIRDAPPEKSHSFDYMEIGQQSDVSAF